LSSIDVDKLYKMKHGVLTISYSSDRLVLQ
jgi:hypothetical protein